MLYIAFEGDDAVPGEAANWKAGTREEFEASLASIGDKLVAKIGGGAGATKDDSEEDGSEKRSKPVSRVLRGVLRA